MIYTLKFLAPIALSTCANEFLSGQGDYCAIQYPPAVIKYYEPGKSCYVNGTFYKNCNEK